MFYRTTRLRTLRGLPKVFAMEELDYTQETEEARVAKEINVVKKAEEVRLAEKKNAEENAKKLRDAEKNVEEAVM